MDDIEFRKLYDSCANYCMKTLQQWTQNREDAEDAFAEAISIYWIRYKQGKIKNHDNIKAYIFKIALNSYRNKLKMDQRVLDTMMKEHNEVTIPWPLQADEPPVKKKVLAEAFKKLSADCQTMLTAKYVYGYRYEDIAEDMGRASANSVKVQTFRCAQYLVKLVDSINNIMTQKP